MAPTFNLLGSGGGGAGVTHPLLLELLVPIQPWRVGGGLIRPVLFPQLDTYFTRELIGKFARYITSSHKRRPCQCGKQGQIIYI